MNATENIGTSIGLLILRLGAGAMMLGGHGWSKVANFATVSGKFPSPLGIGSPQLNLSLAIFAECFCSLLIIVGLLTRLATVPLIVTMIVAAAIVHAADPWAKKELALLYLVPYLTLLAAGPGKFSLDALLFRRKDTPI